MAPNASSDVSTGAPASPSSLPHLNVVDRLAKIQLVNQAWGYANERYAQLKGSNKLFTDTLDRAEAVVQQVVQQVTPVLNKIEQPIHFADNLAVQGLDYVEKKVDSLQHRSGELKDTTLKVVDQAQATIQAVRTQALQTVQARVHSVLALPSNVVPLLDQILNAGENVLDYLLPEGAGAKDSGSKPVQNGTSDPSGQPGGADTKTVLRVIFYRVKSFSDKVQKRIVDYSRDRWIPALFASVVVLKGNLDRLISSAGAAAAAAGEKATAAAAVQNGNSSAAENSNQKQNSTSPKKNTTSNSSSSSPSSNTPNGEAKKSTAEGEQQS